jgi:hypothetical protein
MGHMHFVNLLVKYIPLVLVDFYYYLKPNQDAAVGMAQQLLQRNEYKADLISSYSGGLVAYCWQNYTKLKTTPTVFEF